MNPRNKPKCIIGLLMYDESRIANPGGGEGWEGSVTQHMALELPGSHVGKNIKLTVFLTLYLKINARGIDVLIMKMKF